MRRRAHALAALLVACGAAPSARVVEVAEIAPPPAPSRASIDEGLPEAIEPMPISPGPLPSPPSEEPWAMPADAPAPLAALARAMREVGVPDPSGCEYRAIAIHVGRDCWNGDVGIVRTRGWVLPAAEGSSARWAVAHNGMLYAVAALGAPIDLVDAVERERAGERAPCDVRTGGAGDDERLSVSCRMTPVVSVQLARLGRADLVPSEEGEEEALVSGTLGSLAHDGRSRAIGAHMRGDDVVALHAARIASRANAMAGANAPEPAPPWEPERSGPDLMRIVDQILRDQERRAREPAPPIAEVLAEQPSPAQARHLVALLDQVAARQASQPGGIALSSDPIVQAVLASPDTLDPLIEAVEHDERISRSVSHFRDFAPFRVVLTVREIAARLAMQIMGVDRLWEDRDDYPAQDDHAAIAARLRELARHGRTAAQRHLAQLRDDRAGIATWARAAHELARPIQGEWWVGFDDRWLPGAPREGARIGDALRPREREVARLLARRLREATRSGDPQATHACGIASALVQWRPDAEPLRGLRDRCLEPRAICVCLAGLTVALRALGDADALARYAERVRAQPFAGETFENVIEPILHHPDAPEMVELAQWLVERSPWAREDLAAHVANPRALRVPAFAGWALAELADERVVATLTVTAGGYTLESRAGSSSTTLTPSPDDLPAVGTQRRLRRRDRMAERLSPLLGDFRPYWDDQRRDEVIEQFAARLREHIRGAPLPTRD